MDADLQQLQGTWQAVRIETAGGPVPDEVARRLRYVFAGDRVTLFERDQPTGAGTVTVYPEKDPSVIVVEMTDGPARGQVARGVFEVAGDRLLLCIAPEQPPGLSPAGPAAMVEMQRAPAGGG
jgi:uncharacterized protein (TIGR03067 family)